MVTYVLEKWGVFAEDNKLTSPGPADLTAGKAQLGSQQFPVIPHHPRCPSCRLQDLTCQQQLPHLSKPRALPKSNQPQALTACLGANTKTHQLLPANLEHILVVFAAWRALTGSLAPRFPPGVHPPPSAGAATWHRSCDAAALAFHLLPSCSFEVSARRLLSCRWDAKPAHKHQ